MSRHLIAQGFRLPSAISRGLAPDSPPVGSITEGPIAGGTLRSDLACLPLVRSIAGGLTLAGSLSWCPRGR